MDPLAKRAVMLTLEITFIGLVIVGLMTAHPIFGILSVLGLFLSVYLLLNEAKEIAEMQAKAAGDQVRKESPPDP